MSFSTTATLDKLVSLCKRRAFVYQSAEIYGGLNGIYDFGPLGVLLRNNIKKAWLHSIKKTGLEILQLDGALLGSQAVWDASGHTKNFHDPMVDCLACKHRYRADDVDLEKSCPHCGKKDWTAAREFQMMFKTNLGAMADQASVAYLRPETAQSIFVNFKNVTSTNRVKIPFGIAQIGKAFRNEITPKQFLFRMREFEQMELEWFCSGNEALKWFDFWLGQRLAFFDMIGVCKDRIHVRDHAKDELSHYSSRTSDIEYTFPFGTKELEGIAYRTDFDLSQHAHHSGKDLSWFDEATKQSFTPHVVECSIGVDRLFLTLLFDAYCEDVAEGEMRTVLRFAPHIAPIKAAFLPLSKAVEEPMEKIYREIKKTDLEVTFDVSGSIGKRYRRQDEIGTPFCFTYDFESQQNGSVTVRYRDTMKQERISIDRIKSFLDEAVR